MAFFGTLVSISFEKRLVNGEKRKNKMEKKVKFFRKKNVYVPRREIELLVSVEVYIFSYCNDN